MITIRRATQQDVSGICKVCAAGYRDTYQETHSASYIERVIQEFYQPERILKELEPQSGWDGWFVALDHGRVTGAGAGGLTSEGTGELFVLYLDPKRRGEGIGTLLLNAITEVQKSQGAKEQWVSVSENNQKGIPFYEARGFKRIRRVPTFASKEEEGYYSLRYRRVL
ncbi:GNAT family N-acetyltransferase [Paenactinomyces guangxiensis]|uniref:GNAT family N-acetyltransferase n=1 Tax=Paenactinomyces guangxiensis TaxID=1490290 RepID=A0A7W2AAA9_9BACL|nr:GNAT family N-acetyltransferase [Paenactinomyces guangxiensis]MBA4496024.1 GNAT family N-acetyltransferase [Paenactinomyces guangxiensis]MBH8593100.1 GNAT family N-acetyltransferase [Paenactinomyces guangxiensis]